MAPGIHSPNLEFIYTTLPGPSHSMVSWAQPTSQESQCLVLLHALAMCSWLTQLISTAQHSVFDIQIRRTPDCHYLQNSDYGQEVPYPDFKRTRPLSARNSSPGRRRDVPQRQEREIMEQTFEQLEVVKCFLKEKLFLDGYLFIHLTNVYWVLCVSGGVLYTNDKGVKKTENVSFSWSMLI